jgi:hypothetical protein
MVSVTDHYGRILGFLDRSRYFHELETTEQKLAKFLSKTSRPFNLKQSVE